MKIVGVSAWQRKLNKRINRIENLSEAGLLEAALFIRSESQKEVPFATGNLSNSAFTVSSSGKAKGSKGYFIGETKGEMQSHHDQEVSKAMAETKSSKSLGRPSAQVGYSAVYALAVHENPNAGKAVPRSSGLTQSGRRSTRVVTSGPVSPELAAKGAKQRKWKYLEDPMKNNVGKIISIIRKMAAKGTR